MDEKANDPLSGIARRSLRVIVLLDRSRSMRGKRIESLNQSMLEVLPALKGASAKNANAEVLIRQLEFSSGARWRDDWKPIEQYDDTWTYQPLTAEGITDLGAALDLVTSELHPDKIGSYNYPPVLILISDGQPTDDWESALKRFNSSPFGKVAGRTVRTAINIAGEGSEAVLASFTGNSEMVVDVHNAEQLTTRLKWATVALSKHASEGRSAPRDAGSTGPAPAVPPRPPEVKPASGDDGIIVF